MERLELTRSDGDGTRIAKVLKDARGRKKLWRRKRRGKKIQRDYTR